MPTAIVYEPNLEPELRFDQGETQTPSCLACPDAPCMELTAAEFAPAQGLQDFPQDPSRRVCPTDAMAWDNLTLAPSIDEDQCLGCGLCAVRCPYGAIGLAADGKARVQLRDPDRTTVPGTAPDGPHILLPKHGHLADQSALFVRNLPGVAARMDDIRRLRMVRNMLLACGVGASMRRKGDTNVRMDGVLRFASGQIGVLEFEATATLESPRALLEDIAVLHGRLDIATTDIVPVSIVTALPNRRAEYYQVMADISKVLDINCRTITLAALCLLSWSFRELSDISGLFQASGTSVDLFGSLSQLDPGAPAKEPHAGAYRPAK